MFQTLKKKKWTTNQKHPNAILKMRVKKNENSFLKAIKYYKISLKKGLRIFALWLVDILFLHKNIYINAHSKIILNSQKQKQPRVSTNDEFQNVAYS